MKSGIYVWKLNGIPKYVGYGTNVKKRMNEKHRGNPSLCEYDYDLFEKAIICYCEIDEMRKREAYYIKKFHTHISEGGFNYNWGGGGPLEHSEDSKQKISNATSGEKNPFYGKHHSDESKKKNSESHIGKPLSDDHKKKISLANIGKTMSEQTRKILIKINTGRHQSKETREKISDARIGTHHSEETKKKMSDMRKGVPKTEEHKRKIGDKSRGRKHTEESKNKISENHMDVSGNNNPNFGIKKSNSSSEYFGITKTTDKNKYIYYRTRIVDNGIQIDLGNFKNEIDAAKAWDKYVIEHNLPNPLNFSEDHEEKEV